MRLPPIELDVDGARRTAHATPDRNLLGVLRDDSGLTGTKYGCGEGQCCPTGRRVLYVGNGSNDGAAAERATFVLARRRLLEHCRARGIAHAPFDELHDVAAWIAREVGG